jgi:predicted nucleic acid-binding protein
MPRTVYDTRFFIEHYYSRDEDVLQRTLEEMRSREKHALAIVIHEVYQLTLAREGRESAVLRTTLLEKDFKMVKIDAEIAGGSAEFRHRYKISMADSMIAATASRLKATCLSDDPHFKVIKEIRTRWI